ncbi:MAG TPA: PAS domain-containing protein [Microvirga sp.]|jgi:PAS domain S-box-containing protein
MERRDRTDASDRTGGDRSTSADGAAGRAAAARLAGGENLQAVLSATRLGTWERDLRTHEFLASATYKANLGLPPDEPITIAQLVAMRHPEDRERVAKVIKDAIATGSDYDVEYRVVRPDGSIRRILARGFAISENGVAVRMVGVTLDITEQESTREALERTERRQKLLLELNDSLRTLEDPFAIMESASRMLGSFLGAARVGYGEIDPAGETLSVERDWTDGTVPSVRGRYPFLHSGAAIVAACRAGETIRIADTQADPRTASPEERAGYAGVGARAVLAVPVVKDGRLTGVLFVHEPQPRDWTDDEARLVEDVAERTWLAFERAQAEADLRESEARFRAISEALPALVWVLDTELKLQYVNNRWIRYSNLTPEAALGYSWMEAIHPDDMKRIIADAPELVRNESAYSVEARYRSLPDGPYRWHVIQAEPIRNARGTFVGWCGASMDIHSQKESQDALRQSAVELQLALDAARMGNWSWDVQTNLATLSGRAAEIFGVPPNTVMTWTEIQDLLRPSDAQHAAQAVEASLATGAPYDVEYRVRRANDGQEVWVAAKGQVTRGPDGAALGLTGVVQDITDRKLADERQHLLIRELHHRVKNTLATVQAIVGSTARTTSNIDEFYQGFVGRIVSLAQTHNLLTEDLWQKASLTELLRNELGPYEAADGQRVRITGPEIELPSEAAVPIGMAIHELTTNAAKHGALSTPSGRVEVEWRLSRDGDRPTMRFIWTERDGPPVRPPTRQGFGSRLLQRVLTTQLQADVHMDFQQEGMRFTMHMPIPQPQASLNPRA